MYCKLVIFCCCKKDSNFVDSSGMLFDASWPMSIFWFEVGVPKPRWGDPTLAQCSCQLGPPSGLRLKRSRKETWETYVRCKVVEQFDVEFHQLMLFFLCCHSDSFLIFWPCNKSIKRVRSRRMFSTFPMFHWGRLFFEAGEMARWQESGFKSGAKELLKVFCESYSTCVEAWQTLPLTSGKRRMAWEWKRFVEFGWTS